MDRGGVALPGGPVLILTVVLLQLPLALPVGHRGAAAVLLILRLGPPDCLLVLPARGRAEPAHACGRRDLVSARVGRDDRDGQRPGCERRDYRLAPEPTELEWRSGQDCRQHARYCGNLRVQFHRPVRGFCLAGLLVCALRIALIPGVGTACGALCPLMVFLRGTPGALLCLSLPLPLPLRISPGSDNATAVSACHRPSLGGTIRLLRE